MKYVNLIVKLESFRISSYSRFLKIKKTKKVELKNEESHPANVTICYSITEIVKEDIKEIKIEILKQKMIDNMLKYFDENSKPLRKLSNFKFEISEIPCKAYSLQWCYKNMNSEQFKKHYESL